MRKNEKSFWHQAAQSLPAPVRARYAAYFENAERWELALDAAIEWVSRARTRVSGKPVHA